MSTVRAERRRKRELVHHESQLERADTPRRRLTVICDWLVAEASRGGPDQVREAFDAVARMVQDFRTANNPVEVEEGRVA